MSGKELAGVDTRKILELYEVLITADKQRTPYRKDQLEMANAVIANYQDAVRYVARELYSMLPKPSFVEPPQETRTPKAETSGSGKIQ